MSRIFIKLLSFLFVGVLIFLPKHGTAQRTLGAIWDIPENAGLALQQLGQLEQLGISVLEINQIASDEMLNELAERGFQVYIQVPVRYPIVETYSDPDSSLIAVYERFSSYYSVRDIDAFGVFEYGQTDSRSLPDVLSPFTNSLRNVLQVPLYIKDWSFDNLPVDSLVNFKVIRTHVNRDFETLSDTLFTRGNAFLYRPDPAVAGLVTPLGRFFEKTAINPDAALFFNAGWLLDFTETHPYVGEILAQYATTDDAVFPLPEETLPMGQNHSGIVVILLVLWGALAGNYSFEPTYRRSLFRYFSSHKFFVEDVMERHIRAVIPSLIILVQHAMMGGLFFYCFAATFFSPEGIEVVFLHTPPFPLWGGGYYSFFLIGTITTFVFELFCLCWLYVANVKIRYFSQVSILYSWPLQINLAVITIMTTFLMTGESGFVMTLLFFLFLAVCIAAFAITAFDAGQYLEKYRSLYSAGTIGLYFVLIGGVVFWMFNNSYLLNMFSLASTIP